MISTIRCSKRHGLAMVNMLDKEGRIDLTDPAFASGLSSEAKALAGRPRFEARKAIVAFLEAVACCVRSSRISSRCRTGIVPACPSSRS